MDSFHKYKIIFLIAIFIFSYRNNFFFNGIIILVILDQLKYLYYKRYINGPKFVIPFIGSLFGSFYPEFKNYIDIWNFGEISCSSVLHKFIVFANSNELSKKVFNTPKEFTPLGVASMKQIFFHDNWIFLQGKEHSQYRKLLLPLFTKNALSFYLPIQEQVYKKNTNKWFIESKLQPIQMINRIREMNMETALEVFCGKFYLNDTIVKEMTDAFKTLTLALQLVNIPFNIPGTSLNKAIKSRNLILNFISKCIDNSKQKILNKEKPESLLEKWLVKIYMDETYKVNKEFTNHELSLVIMTMIFASQDASTSSLVWALQILANHPKIINKIRMEQKINRPNNENLTFENIQKMSYLWNVVKEILRFRPPVLMMPYEAQMDTKLGNHSIKKGAVTIASIYPSLHDPEVFKNPDKFDPERFQDNDKLSQNYLVFGFGPHMCIGKDYAMTHLIAFLSYLLTNYNIEHIKTEKSENIIILATIFPEDGCFIKLYENK